MQFWVVDSSQSANAFTYGGNHHAVPDDDLPPRGPQGAATFVFPVAFVNWYPCLYLLGRPDPFGLPSWFAFLPVVALLTLVVAGLAWRTGVRHYTSTGS